MSRPLTSQELMQMVLSGKYDGQLDVRNVVSQRQGEMGIPVTDPQYLNPAVTPVADPFTGNQPASYTRQTPQIPGMQPFQPTNPAPQLMTLDQMMEVINNRVNLATEPQIESALRKLEEQQLSGEKQKGAVTEAYTESKRDLGKQGMQEQQIGARIMNRRGIYDSGLSADLAGRISASIMARGGKLSEQQARVLSDIAEYLDLQQRHTSEEIQGIMGQRGQMAQSMLDEMHSEQQSRGDMLAQNEFENWLRSEAHALNTWAEQMNEYWREQDFDSGRSDTEWNQWFNERESVLQENQRAWERVSTMNRDEAAQELNRLMFNNQISQQEFENAMALEDFDLRVKLYEWQSL